MTKPEKKFIFLLKSACDTDLRPKILAVWSMTILARSANYSSSAFFAKKGEVMLVMTKYAINYGSTICQSLTHELLHVKDLCILN